MSEHPHFDLYCREHDVRIGGCRCPGPDKLKQTTDCPGDSCPGNKQLVTPSTADDGGARERELRDAYAAGARFGRSGDPECEEDTAFWVWTGKPTPHELHKFIEAKKSAPTSPPSGEDGLRLERFLGLHHAFQMGSLDGTPMLEEYWAERKAIIAALAPKVDPPEPDDALTDEDMRLAYLQGKHDAHPPSVEPGAAREATWEFDDGSRWELGDSMAGGAHPDSKIVNGETVPGFISLRIVSANGDEQEHRYALTSGTAATPETCGKVVAPFRASCMRPKGHEGACSISRPAATGGRGEPRGWLLQKIAVLQGFAELCDEWAKDPIAMEGSPGAPDAEVIPWLVAFNAIPGVYTLQSCIGHGVGSPKHDGDYPGWGHLWFRVRVLPGPIDFENTIEYCWLTDREDFPVLEVRFPKGDRAALGSILKTLSRFVQAADSGAPEAVPLGELSQVGENPASLDVPAPASSEGVESEEKP